MRLLRRPVRPGRLAMTHPAPSLTHYREVSHGDSEAVSIPEPGMVAGARGGDSPDIHARPSVVVLRLAGGQAMLKYFLAGKPGWWVLHAVAVILVFYLGHRFHLAP